jgi:hypothetical protein
VEQINDAREPNPRRPLILIHFKWPSSHEGLERSMNLDRQVLKGLLGRIALAGIACQSMYVTRPSFRSWNMADNYGSYETVV